MSTQYLFGHENDMAMLETIGAEHTDLRGFVSVTVRTDVDETTHSCTILEKYRSAEGIDGLCYDWYFIDNYFRDTDRTPAIRGDLESTQSAANITFVALAESGGLDEVTASEHAELFAEWAYPIAYTAGQLRRHNGKLYKCVQAHTSQADWTPDTAASLWSVAADPAEEWPAWSQPVGAHDAYAKGDKVSHNGKHWTSSVDSNVWEPGVYGWDEYTE